jgi:protoheme IX farnesyltransferase
LIGGAFMSGGASAMNHYFDRDIEWLMGRTVRRPIPPGLIAPHAALGFGVGLVLLGSAVLLGFVNALACGLALLGVVGYVGMYTLWLKRLTPSNIVTGRAARAIPPLVSGGERMR